MAGAVVLGCGPASEREMTFLLFEMENVLYAGPLLLPRVYPGEVPLASVVYAVLNWPNSAVKGW